MIRVLFFSSLALLSLEARENPFFPSKGEKDIAYTSNSVKTIAPLKHSSIGLPSSARIIKKVTIEYENLDASVETKSIKLNNSVDWHLPIFITQSYDRSKPRTKQIKKRNYKEIASIKYAKFFSYENTLKIITKDKIIRNFILPEPHRIVIDFKKDASLKSYSKENKKGIFCKVRVGNHEGYYRAVIELDGKYRYEMQKIPNGYLFTLR
ncbi:MAG: AMIN domain-containing protein [Sulfurimonas sp.]|nr:AMIN domain-containing protein [Sulfurimonas sp.]